MVKQKFVRLKRFKLQVRKLLGYLPPIVREFSYYGHPVAEVTLTEEMINTAEELAFKVRKLAREKGLREVISASLEKEIIGLLNHFGWFQYAFGDWREGLQFLRIGEGDAMDSSYKGYSIDVKGRSQPWHDLMMVPKEQVDRKPHDFYIGAQMVGPRKVWIWGYATSDEVKHAEIGDFGHGPTYAIPFIKLNPISAMLRLRPKDKKLVS